METGKQGRGKPLYQSVLARIELQKKTKQKKTTTTTEHLKTAVGEDN